MPDKRDHRYCSIHVMKTGGGTLRQHIKANFEPSEIYPMGGLDNEMMKAFINVPKLLSIAPERKAQVRVFHGHFPYMVADALGLDLVTLTILREPVARTLSYMKHALRVHPHLQPGGLEAVYDDPLLNPMYIQNHQAKIFSICPEDEAPSLLQAITVDASRLEVAKENLAKVDVFGLIEHHDVFLRTLATDYGWAIGTVENKHVSGDEYDVPDSLIDRIVEDNAMDIAFYEFAQKLWAAQNSA